MQCNSCQLSVSLVQDRHEGAKLEEFVLGRRRSQRKREREKKDSSKSREGNLEVWTSRLASAKWKSVFRSFIAFFIIPEKENALLP